jgi:starch synthase
MKTLFIASEAFPLAKVGGLADVTSSLAVALHDLGHKPRLILPKYSNIRTLVQDVPRGNLVVSFMGHDEQVAVKMAKLKKGIPVYLIENDHYFGTDQIYTGEELKRFLFFSLIVPAVVSQLGLRPDIIHCHDWHTALTPLWLRKAKMKIPCIFTIHNLAYQGSFDQQFLSDSRLSSVWHEYIPASAPRPALNFMSQGILLADIVTTVSPTYASEILTSEYGVGLERLLNYRNN